MRREVCLFIDLKWSNLSSQSMLKWFIDEQVEEEEGVQDILNHLRMVKDNGYGLYMIDKELGARTYTQASPLAASAE
jgi:ferritin